MSAILTLSFTDATISYGSNVCKRAPNDLLLCVGYMILVRRNTAPNKPCRVTKVQLVHVMNLHRKAAGDSEMSDDSIRQSFCRILGTLKRHGLDVVDSVKGNVGPFVFKVSSPRTYVVGLNDEQLRAYLKIPKKTIQHMADINFDQTELVDTLIEFNESERITRAGRNLEYDPRESTGSNSAILSSLNRLAAHRRDDIRELASFSLIKIHIREFRHDEARRLLHALGRTLKKAKDKDAEVDPYVELKYKLYCAWLDLREGEYENCAAILDTIDESECYDRQLLALYCNLRALVIKDQAIEHFRTGMPDAEFDDHVHAQTAIRYHQIALQAQMQANDIDGIQNTCTSLANTYFSFSHRYAISLSEKMREMGFKWLLTSVAMNHDFLAGGYAVNNIITIAKAVLDDDEHDFKWLKSYAKRMGRDTHAFLEPYNTLEELLEATLAMRVNKTKNKRERAYLLGVAAQAYLKSGNKKVAIERAKASLELFVELEYSERVSEIRQLILEAEQPNT